MTNRLPKLAHAGFPRPPIVRRCSAGHRWTIVSTLDESLATGTERTRQLALAAGAARRKAIIEELKNLPSISTAPRSDTQPGCSRSIYGLHELR